MPVDQMVFHAVEAQSVLDAMAIAIPLDLDLRTPPPEWETMKVTYTFNNHFHPYVGRLLEELNKRSIDGLLDADLQNAWEDFFNQIYQPIKSDKVAVEYFPKEIDVSEDGAYAIYNWELLFHVPLTIAVHLSKNQRFAEAQRWFHYIFDPTANDGQFWRFLAFRKKDVRQIDELLRLLSKRDDQCQPDELREKLLLLSGYEMLRNNPFQPHVVARTRFLAYRFCVVMKYLDNLIAWGDSLFRQDTLETLNEATQVYVLAANLLGPKPQRIPSRGTVRPKTFAQLRKSDLDQLGNALVDLEGQFPFNLYLPTTGESGAGGGDPLFGIGRTLYFCLPRNEQLLGYWDTVADRLFKIRHCMNIEGVVRQLPLFQPPLDPGMLVKAAAAGIDISSLVSGLNQPLSPVRSALLIQKALEICGEVRGLGGALLSALEKKDAEALGLLRQKHEINIQQLAQDVRYLQWKEAEAATESLLKSRESAVERYRYYRRLLGGKEEDLQEIEGFSLKRQELTEENFDEFYAELVGQYAQESARMEYPSLTVMDEGRLYLNPNEYAELGDLLPLARDLQSFAFALRELAPSMALIPDFPIDLHYWGLGGTITFGGTGLTSNMQTAADVFDHLASRAAQDASIAAKTASYERRADEWMFQSNLAARELAQIGRQIISSLIHEQITRLEYENLKAQIEQAEELRRFLEAKFTGEALYNWMQGELSKLYYEYYKFAFDVARRAEQTMKHELMRPELDELAFIKFNYWDGGRKGLLSGEALHLDLKRMEMAYHDQNKREYELTKHVSLRQLNPLALLLLKATGACEVTLPEWLFDLDGPGHYMRRIKNVSVSIPSVTGPYTSVNCTLSLLRSTIRKSALPANGDYGRQGREDGRFVDYYGTIESVVTSSGNNDSGMFETNLREERFLPFEGAGAESTWRLELPAKFRQFDYNTISDVILHVRYTARQGGAGLRDQALSYLDDLITAASTSGLTLLLSLQHDFPTEWHQFATGEMDFSAKIERDYFPYVTQGREITLDEIQLHAIEDKEVQSITQELSLVDLSTELANEGAFTLTLAPDGTVLTRGQEAPLFVLLKYSLRPD